MDHPVIGLTANTTKPNAAELTQRMAAQFRQGGARLLCEGSGHLQATDEDVDDVVAAR